MAPLEAVPCRVVGPPVCSEAALEEPHTCLTCPLSLSDSLDRFKGLKPTVILLSRGISDAESSWRAGQGWQRKGRLRSVVWARTKPPPLRVSELQPPSGTAKFPSASAS